MRSKGYTPAIMNVCQRLDANLKIMYDDLSLYLDFAGATTTTSVNHSDVITHLQESSRDSIAQLITTIKSTEFQPTQPAVIALATVLRAIAELCPNLRRCLFQKNNSNVQRSEQWDGICRLLEEESDHFWLQWIEMFTRSLFAPQNYFPAERTLVELARDLLAWQTITVEEKDETDRPIESTIRVPQAPALSLQRCLDAACTRLNDIVPYALPRTVGRLFSAHLITQLLAIYQRYVDCDFVRSNQTASLQAYFDIKFLQLVLVQRTDKVSADALQSLAQKFKSNVDPFDFELFHKYLVVNVKRAAQRMLHKLGGIIPNAEQVAALAAGAAAVSVSAADKEPNVLALSTAGMDGWFSMLPVMSSTNSTVPIGKSTELVSFVFRYLTFAKNIFIFYSVELERRKMVESQFL